MLSQSSIVLRHCRLRSAHLIFSLYVMTVAICLDVQHAGSLPLNDDINLRAGVDQTVLRRGRREVVVVNKSSSVCKADDEFYDAVVARCAQCSDVCDPQRLDNSLCMNNCPAYYRYHLLPANKPSSSTSPTLTTTSGSGSSAVGDQLIRKPLFWTSVASLTVAVAASIVIVVLCVVQRQKPRRRGEKARFDRNQLEQTLSVLGVEPRFTGADV